MTLVVPERHLALLGTSTGRRPSGESRLQPGDLVAHRIAEDAGRLGLRIWLELDSIPLLAHPGNHLRRFVYRQGRIEFAADDQHGSEGRLLSEPVSAEILPHERVAFPSRLQHFRWRHLGLPTRVAA